MIAAFLLSAGTVSEAGAPQDAVGGARLLQGQSGGGAVNAGGMIVLLFDANSMSLTEAQRAVAAAAEWTDARADGELTSVVLVGSELNVLSDFTADRAQLRTVLRSEALLNGLVAVDTGPQAIRFGASADTQGAAQTASALADARLRGFRMLCETIAPIPQRKAIIFFSSELGRGNQELLRAATNACNRANVTVNPIDARGLMMNARPAPAK
jgi:VWFA-related protein